MFALLTVYWVLSVVFTFLDIDSWNNIIKACYGGAVCTPRMPAAPLLPMFDDILLVNVSTVQYTAPASYLTLSTSSPRELTRFPEILV
jgi:hypothetical protein